MILVICLNHTKHKQSRFDSLAESASLLHNVEVRVVTISADINLCISAAILSLENELITSNQFWSDDPRYSAIVLVFDTAWLADISDIVDRCHNLRGDEMIFSTIDCHVNIDWIIAHPRSMIRWAAGLPYVSNLDFNIWPNLEDKALQAFYVWWAQRSNLKVLS